MVPMIALDAPERVAATAAPAACVRLTRPLAQGQAPVAADLIATPCATSPEPASADRAWRYGQGALRARRPLAQGETVSAPPAGLVAVVAPGQVLRISVRAGPVVVERHVTAVQSARAGQDVLVRDDSGEVFTVAASTVAP